MQNGAVRWRYNAMGAEWFWHGHWYPVITPIQHENLCVAIREVTADFMSPDDRLTESLRRLLREAS